MSQGCGLRSTKAGVPIGANTRTYVRDDAA